MTQSAAALSAELGDEIASLYEPIPVLGQTVGVSLRPRDGRELSACLRALSQHELPALVRGSGSRLSLGNPLAPVSVLLSTERIAGIGEFDRQDGVLRVGAGTPLAEVRDKVRAEGWELPLDPPGASATIGGVIATAAIGPRGPTWGPVRRCILGLDVVLASGERTRCGGRVVKNVTGYDMAKLYTGSLGGLGVVESAWLRLRPAPAETRTLVAVFERGDPSRGPLALAASRRDSVRVAARVDGPAAAELGAPTAAGAGSAATMLVVECAGDAGAVERDADWLAAELGARPVSEQARLVGRLRDLQGAGSLRARLALLPTRLDAVLDSLGESGLGTIAHPAAGLVWALAPEDADETAVTAIERAARAADAELLFESLPDALRGDRDVFGGPGSGSGASSPTLAALLRELKRRFDPQGILNPGRMQGFL